MKTHHYVQNQAAGLIIKFLSCNHLPILFCFALFQFHCSHHLQENDPNRNLNLLREQITSLIGDPNLFNAQIGLYIESMSSGELIYQCNEHKLFIPASNMKIFTTATALLKFGPHFRFQTQIYTDGPITQNKLKGNLVIRGKGDPTLAPRFNNGQVLYVFNNWVDSLRAHGIQEIDGDLIGDVSYFQGDPLGNGWQWDDEPYWYSAQISALSLNDNCIDVAVVPNDSIGLPPLIQFTPSTCYFSIENQARTGPADSVPSLILTRPRMQNILIAKNEMPINKPLYKESISVENPALFYMTVLSEVMATKGIVVHGSLVIRDHADQDSYDSCRLLFTHISPELSEIIKVTNKISHNLYAEQLLLTLAAEYGQEATAAAGTQVVLRQMNEIGITEMEYIMVDGSGLSRGNLLTPNAVSTLLRYMAHHPYFTYFYESLPVTGIDGTLSNRMKNTFAEKKVHAKTGFVGHVRNLSGYVCSRDDEYFLFSMLVNNYSVPTSLINLLQDKICNLLSNFQR